MSRLRGVGILTSIAEAEEDSSRRTREEVSETILSPISDIARDLRKTRLLGQNRRSRAWNRTTEEEDHSTVCRRTVLERYDNCNHGHGHDHDHGHDHGHGHNNRAAKVEEIEEVEHTEDAVNGLFKNAFKIRGTSENAVKVKPKVRRLRGMASRRLSSISGGSGSPSTDKENTIGVYAPCGSSPQKIAGMKKSRYPLEDCDPNSQDSGYGASYSEREDKSRENFRFAEPLAVAPRRMSVESASPLESPVRSSPRRGRVGKPGRVARADRPSLFRSLSSGYESMDDGFNDLIDVEILEDATRLPNGMSSLLSGDIVAGLADDVASVETIEQVGSVTPKLSPQERYRDGAVARSMSLRNERPTRQPEEPPASTLSKVRSCLFRSPNASSSTASLLFDEASPATTFQFRSLHRRRAGLNSGYAVDYATDYASDCAADYDIDYAVLLDSPVSARTLKRRDPPMEESPKLSKKSRQSNTFLLDVTPERIPSAKPSSLQRSFSEPAASSAVPSSVALLLSEELNASTESLDARTPGKSDTEVETETRMHDNIKWAIYRSTTDSDLTGDFSKPCVLPLAEGHHEDLKSISVDTLAALVRGEFNDRIGSFKIVDCRYPYEFDAGHIEGALNLYNKDLIEQILLNPLTTTPVIQPDSNKRNILVFHCEFSWERGPNLSRFLRNLDRERNKEHYPALHYPEVYLLHGGYQQFYKERKDLCSPQGYRPMRHPDHEEDLRQFRSKSKSWQGERSRIVGITTRTNLKRLGF